VSESTGPRQGPVGAGLRTTGGTVSFTASVAEVSHQLIAASALTDANRPIDLAALSRPKATPEIAFILRGAISGVPTIASVLAATEVVVGVVTVSDQVSGQTDGAAPDTVRIVLGPRAVPPGELEDLRLLGCVLRINGEVTATSAAAAAMGHPAAAVACLVDRLANCGNDPGPGWLLCSGPLMAPVDLSSGTAVTAEFDGLGTIDFSCV